MERNFYIFTFFMLAIVLIGCNFFDKKGKSETEKILKSPPFDVLTDSIRLLPENADLYKQRAGLLSQKGFHELATEDFKKAWAIQPDEMTATAYVSNLMITAKLNDALDLLHQCMKMYPANTDFKKKLAEVYVGEGRRGDALALYDVMIKKDSNDFEAWYEKGALLANLADTAQAIADLERSYSIQPLQLSGLALANLYAETKNKKTLSLCDALLKADSTGELIDAVFLKGTYYSNIDDYANAIAQFDQCIKMDWKFTDAYIEKGIIFIEQKKPQEAITTLQLATTVSNTDADVYYWLGRAYEAAGNKEEALNNYIRATQLDRNFTQAKEGIKRMKN